MTKQKYSLCLLTCFVLIINFQVNTTTAQARKKTNWLEDKKSHIERWRVGVGVSASEPLGGTLQLYRLSGICKKTISIRKKFSIDISFGQEGYLFNKAIERKHSEWKRGGMRAAIDLKIYFPLPFNPYIGLGSELGNRYLNSNLAFHTDAVGRVGIEQKMLGIRTSSSSNLHASLFVEGKYNHCLTANFKYLLPSFGIRLHFL